MDYTANALQTIISIGVVIADFLANTGRIPIAIVLFKECLILLNNKALENEKEYVQVFSNSVHLKLLRGYQIINDCLGGIECGTKLLASLRGTGERERTLESAVLVTTASFYERQGKYEAAKELYENALNFLTGFGRSEFEALCFIRLANVFLHTSKYKNAEKCLQKALKIATHDGTLRDVEAISYVLLGDVFDNLGEYVKAEEYLRKALVIDEEIGDRRREAQDYRKLGCVLQKLGKSDQAEQYLQKALEFAKLVGDQETEVASYLYLGRLFTSLGEIVKAKEWLTNAQTMLRTISDRRLEALFYQSLGESVISSGLYVKAEEFLQKSIEIRKEIGDRRGEANCFMNMDIPHKLM